MTARPAHPGRSAARIAGAVIWTALALLPACGPGPGLQRFIEEDPTQALDPPGRSERSEAPAAAGSAWKVDLAGDRRNALLTAPGTEIVREVTLGAGSELRLALGSLPRATPTGPGGGPGDPVALAAHRVTVVPRGGDPVVVLDEILEPGREWHERVIDLSPFAGGGRVRISLEAVAPATGAPVARLPVWANPEVVTPARGQRAPNLVLISLDTLRADRMSLNGYHRPTTPEIDSWARGGVNFRQAVAAATWTRPSHASIFTGLDALSHDVDQDDAVRPELTLLAERLRSRGWATLAVTGGGLLHPRIGFDQGFDRYTYRRRRPGGDGGTELEHNLELALEAIEAHRERPFFLFFHTYEIHSPFRPRQPFLDRLTGSTGAPEDYEVIVAPVPDFRPDEGLLVLNKHRRRRSGGGRQVPLRPEEMDIIGDLYDAGIAYADAAIGRLLRSLGAADLAEMTLVVLTSDHGEALAGDGSAGHGMLPEHQVMVPLAISFPGRVPRGKTVDEQVRSIDILPTVLELLELPPAEGIDGVSLVPLMRGERSAAQPPAWIYSKSQGAAVRVANRWRYEFYDHPWPPASGRSRLLDLRAADSGGGGPGEVAPDLAALDRKMIARLEALSGLGLTLSNSTPHALRVDLRSKTLDPRMLRTTEPCDCVEWSSAGRQKGLFRFTIRAERSHYFLMAPIVDPLILEGALDGTGNPGLRLEIDVTSLDSPLGWSLAGDEWVEWNPLQPRPATGIVVEWRGDAALRGGPPEPPDPELQRQLRALGYLE